MADKKEERVAGKSVADNLIRTGIKSGFLKFFDFALDTRVGTLVLESIPDFIKNTSATWEYGATYAVGVMPTSWFPSPTWAHFAEEFFVEIARHTDKKIQSLKSGEHLTANDVTEAVDKAGEKVLAKGYGLDACGLGHEVDCVMCAHGKVKLTPVTMADMLRNNVLIAPCCFSKAKQTLQEQEAAACKKAPSNSRLKSAAEVFAAADAGDVQVVMTWLNTLVAPQKGEVETFLQKHLDSVLELHQLADCLRNHPQNIDFMLQLIQNGNGMHHWNRAFEYVISAWNWAGTKNEALNAKFEPFIAEMQTRKTTGRSTWQVLNGVPATVAQPAPQRTKWESVKAFPGWAWEQIKLTCSIF